MQVWRLAELHNDLEHKKLLLLQSTYMLPGKSTSLTSFDNVPVLLTCKDCNRTITWSSSLYEGSLQPHNFRRAFQQKWAIWRGNIILANPQEKHTCPSLLPYKCMLHKLLFGFGVWSWPIPPWKSFCMLDINSLIQKVITRIWVLKDGSCCNTHGLKLEFDYCAQVSLLRWEKGLSFCIKAFPLKVTCVVKGKAVMWKLCFS